jgi:hypothetical protein
VLEHFISNPFSAKKPLQNFGILKKGTEGDLWYQESDGLSLPYVGPVLDFKDDDPQSLRPELRYKGCVAVLDLSDAEDMETYRALAQKFCQQHAILSMEEREYDPEVKNWRVLIRWMEPFYGAPEAALRVLKETAAANDGKLPPPPEVKEMFPESPAQKPEDLAKVQAEAAAEEEQVSETEQTDEEIPARYGTVDEAIHAFGHLFGEEGEED